MLFLVICSPLHLRLAHTTQLLVLLGSLGAIILALDAANHGGSSRGAGAADDESRESTTLDAAGVEPLGVSCQLQATFRVVTVDDGRPFLFWEIGLVFIPQLETERKSN